MDHQQQMDEAIKGRKLYFIGEELPKDWYAAFRQWLPLAEAGDPKAQYNIGRCYCLGMGVEDDKEKGLEWYLKSANQEDPRAHYNLYLFYKEIDQDKSSQYFEKALRLNDYRALAQVRKAEEKRIKDEDLRSKNEATEKENKRLKAIKDYENLQFVTLKEAVQKANKYLEEDNKFHARDVLNTLSKEEDFGFIKDVLPYFDLECLNYKFIKELVGMSTSHMNTIRDGNSDVVKYFHEDYKYKVKVKVKNKSVAVLDLGDRLLTESDKVQKVLLSPDEEVEFISYGNRYTASITFPEGHGGNSGKKLELLFKLGNFKIPGKTTVTKKSIFGCFVLTACFGDEDDPVVMSFRKFRDEKLLTNKFGKIFVKLYYKYGPSLARFIIDKPKIKKVLRNTFSLVEKIIK